VYASGDTQSTPTPRLKHLLMMYQLNASLGDGLRSELLPPWWVPFAQSDILLEGHGMQPKMSQEPDRAGPFRPPVSVI
jgi:hypothetical protein